MIFGLFSSVSEKKGNKRVLEMFTKRNVVQIRLARVLLQTKHSTETNDLTKLREIRSVEDRNPDFQLVNRPVGNVFRAAHWPWQMRADAQ